MGKHKLTFGKSLKLNRLVSIDEVERGLNCNCICPFEDCNELLEACKGKFRTPYFRHKSKKNCLGAFESQLHLLSKEIIIDNKSVCIPEYKKGSVYFIPEIIKFDTVQSEVITGDRKPDIIGIFTDNKGNKQNLWIEIRHTHAVDECKTRYIKESNVNCLEIDVRQFLENETIDKKELEGFLLKEPQHREWINCFYKDTEINRILGIVNEIKTGEQNILDLVKQYTDDERLRPDLGTTLLALYQTKPNSNDYFIDKKTLSYMYNIVSKNIGIIENLSDKGRQRYISLVQLLYFEIVRWDRYNNEHYKEKMDAYKDCSSKRKEFDNNLLKYAKEALSLCKDLLPTENFNSSQHHNIH